ncbi:MAG: hypothetical protein FJY29_07945 [Betaproteobacteria bacterium]|nr:hypothetical protein [Betaproteobacteria bacterium]
MNSIRSELNSLVISEFRSRKASSAGLFSVLWNIFLAALCALLCEQLVLIFPESALVLRSLAVIFIGTRWRALGNMMHECAHGIFVEKALDNTFFGYLISAIELSDFQEYVKQHVSHHAYLGHPERDLDYKSRRIFLDSRRPYFLQISRILCLCAALVPLWLQTFRPVAWSRSCPRWCNNLRAVLLGVLLFALLIPATQLYIALYLVLPYITTYQWMKIFSDSADHLFLYGKEDLLERSRNHLLPSAFLNWLLFPRNDAYHLLHHLFPSLPTHHYPRAHSILLQHPWYRNRKHHFIGWDVSSPLPEVASGPK